MELRDLDGIHVIGWSFGAGSLAGLAWRLLQRKGVTWRQVAGGVLASGLMGSASAVALRTVAPDKPEIWLSVSIALGLTGTDSITGVARVMVRAFAQAYDDKDKDNDTTN